MRRGAQIEIAIVAVAVTTLVLVVVALMDLMKRPPRTFEASGTRRETWIAVLIVSLVIPVPGILGPLLYLGPVRRRLNRASR